MYLSTKYSCPALARCRPRKIYAMIAVELGALELDITVEFEDRFVRTDFRDRAAIVVYTCRCIAGRQAWNG